MSVFLMLLPIYIFGNLHCIGMCGPLVLMLGTHRYRYFYFLGRTLSFTLAGLLAGGIGAVLQAVLHRMHISAITSFVFGGAIALIGVGMLFGKKIDFGKFPALSRIGRSLSLLILKDRPWQVFLFGFFTVFLPCGQTVIVYSAIALEGNLWIGLGNGLAFAILTSPSLFIAMQARNFFGKLRGYYQYVFGACALITGGLALCRGLAEVGMIPHLVLNPEASDYYHIALY